ncbi:hypothetical protein TWF730_000863 [Orbilia blumenaviensis]|uniref:Uncharacterized protein n=1 Tax=Orbilia blumenaviensis TaxID=1796055 RepID=A0AAV9VN72_9PEZI
MGLRYTIEDLLLIKNSPLVEKPPSLPPLEEWMGTPLPTRPTPAPRKPGEELGVDDKDSTRRTGFGHTSRGSDDLISGTGPSKPTFTSTHSRKPFGNDHDAFAPSTSETATSRFSHFSNSNRDDDDKGTSTTPRIGGFSFNRFGMPKDTNPLHRNDRNERGFGRTGDDNRRDRDDKTGTATRPRFGAKDGDEGGWNTVTRPRKSFGHNDDGDKFRREHGRTGGDNRDRDNKDRTNRYEPFSKDRTDRDSERTNTGGWKDRDHNKRQGGKGREEGSWFLSDEERAARNAIKEREFREQREQRAAEREFRNGGLARHDRDRDREHRDQRDIDRETFGDSKNFGRGFEKHEKEPEWMDAMPGNDGKEFKAHSTEDFQRWKAAMKARNQPQSSQQQQQPQPAEEKPAPKEPKDEEIVFKSKAEKRATALEEAQAEPVDEPPTPSVAENGVDRFWGWNTSSTSLASKTTSDGGAKLPAVSSGEKTPAVERSSRFRNFFNAPVQDQLPAELPSAPPQNGNQEQLIQLQAQQVQQIHQQHQMLQKQLGQAQQVQQQPPPQQQPNISQYQQYQNQLLQQTNLPQMNQVSAIQQHQAVKDKQPEASKEDREGFNNILQMLGRARLSSPTNAEAQNAFLSILGAPSQQSTPVSRTHPTPPASHPSNNLPGPPPPQQQQQQPQPHSNITRLPSGLQSSQGGSIGGNDTILKLLRHSDMPTPQGPPPPPTFLQDYQTPNGPPVSISPPAVSRSGKSSVLSALNDPAIRAIGRPGDSGPPGLPKNLYHEPPQHVRSPSQIMEAHHRGFPGMDIRPPPGMDRNTPLEAQKTNFLNEQSQRNLDPRHVELLHNEQRRRMMEQQMHQMAAAGVQELPHRNFPPNAPPRMEQRGPQGPPQPQGPPNADQGPPMGLPGMGGETGQIPGNWAPGPQQHPSQQSQSGPAGNANPQRPPPGFFQRGPAGPPVPTNGGNVAGPGGPGGPMPPLPFYGPGPGLANMPPLPFGQHGMPPPPNMPNMPTFPFPPPPGPGGPPPPMPPQGFPPFPFHEGMMPFGAGPDGLRSPQHQHLGGAPPGMFSR